MYLNKCVVFIIIFNYKRADSKDTLTDITFNVSIKDEIPTCTNNPIRGPVTVQQRFRVSAKSNDEEFAANVTTCFFNSKTPNLIHLKPADERNGIVTSDEIYFTPEMDGKHLICELGLDMMFNINNTNILTVTNRNLDLRYPAARCVTTIYLKGNETAAGEDIKFSNIDYKMLMIIGFSLASMFLLIIIIQNVILCICFSKGNRSKREDKNNRNSVVSDSGTIYEDIKPPPQETETRTLDERNNRVHNTEYVPSPTLMEIKTYARPPRPNNIQPNAPVAQQLNRQQIKNSITPPAVSSKRISDIILKFEGRIKPMAPGVRVTSVLKPKKCVASEQIEPIYNNGGLPLAHKSVTPMRHHIEDDQTTCMDSEDSDEWIYEPLEEVYEMPGS